MHYESATVGGGGRQGIQGCQEFRRCKPQIDEHPSQGCDSYTSVSMGCVDSGSVAHIRINNRPPVEDKTAWSKLFIKIASATFDPADSKSFAAWLPDAKFTRTERFILSAGVSKNIDLSIDVEPLIDGMSTEVTMSVTYH